MSRPPSGDLPPSPPLAGFSYVLTGSIRGAVTVDPDGTHLDINSTSSKNPWDQNPRVRASLDAASRPPVLRCQVRADESAPTAEMVWGVTAPVAAARFALHDDARAPWGQLAYDRDSMRLIDPDGKIRVEIVRVQPGAPPSDEGFPLPAAGPALFHVRVVDAHGTPVNAGMLLQP
jgi:hypothetical protein